MLQNYVEIAFGEYGQKVILVYSEMLAGIMKIRNEHTQSSNFDSGASETYVNEHLAQCAREFFLSFNFDLSFDVRFCTHH